MKRGKFGSIFFKAGIVMLGVCLAVTGCGRINPLFSNKDRVSESGDWAEGDGVTGKGDPTNKGDQTGKGDPADRDGQKGSSDLEKIEKVFHWNASHLSMPEEYEGATINGNRIYAYRFVEGGVEISVFAADQVNASGTIKKIEVYKVPDVTEVKSISINVSNQICLWGSEENGDALWQVNPGGDIDTIKEVEVEDLGLFPDLKGFYADNNGLYYLWYEMSVPCAEVYEGGEEDVYTILDRIYVKDQEMKTIVYEQVPDSYNNKLLGFAFDEDGIPMLFAKSGEGYCYVKRVRTTDREEYEIKRLENNEFMELGEDSILAFVRDGLLYTKEGALYLYRLSEAKEEKLLELAGAGILAENIIYLGMNGGAIEIIDHYSGQQSEYTVITEGETEKKHLTLGIMSLSPQMRKIIASYNRYQEEVTLEPIVYMENGDWDYDGGYQRLTLDLIQGRTPDLICTDGLEYENLARMGAFSDLYLFMQEDGVLNKENLISSVLGAYEMNGHLYTMAPEFIIFTMWGAESTVEGREGVDLEELMQVLREHGGDINSIGGSSADESILTTLCALSMDKFIDWEKGSCDFTGQDFRQILDFVKAYQGIHIGSAYEAIHNGEILLEMGIITSVEDYRLESEIYGEKIQFIGYPTESGSGSAVQFIGNQLAISSESPYQKEAWEFLKYCMQNGCEGIGFPILRKEFDRLLEKSLEEEFDTENGGTGRVVKRSYAEKDIIRLFVYKCEPEDAEAIRNLVEHIDSKFRYHTEIQKIIEEEVPAYIQGQKKIEDVCGIIQNRVQLYLWEKQ